MTVGELLLEKIKLRAAPLIALFVSTEEEGNNEKEEVRAQFFLIVRILSLWRWAWVLATSLCK